MLALATQETHRVTSRSAPAYAKINLTLDVLGRRKDGFHELRSLIIGLALHDTVQCTRSEKACVEISCSDPSLAGPGNLAAMAATRLARRLDRDPGVEIRLEKAIPVGGGLGGGGGNSSVQSAGFREMISMRSR